MKFILFLSTVFLLFAYGTKPKDHLVLYIDVFDHSTGTVPEILSELRIKMTSPSSFARVHAEYFSFQSSDWFFATYVRLFDNTAPQTAPPNDSQIGRTLSCWGAFNHFACKQTKGGYIVDASTGEIRYGWI